MTLEMREKLYGRLLTVERKIECLESSFCVLSQPAQIDCVNLQLYALHKERNGLFERLKNK